MYYQPANNKGKQHRNNYLTTFHHKTYLDIVVGAIPTILRIDDI